MQRAPTLDGLGELLPRGGRGVAGRAGRRRAGAARRRSADVLVSYLPVGSEDGPALLRAGVPRRRRRLRERDPGVHRERPRVGREVRGGQASRSSATTSRARSAPRSCTASSPASSRTGAWRSTTRTSSTSAATWTSRTCWSASGCSRRRSRRRSRSRARSTQGIDARDVHIGPSDHVPWLDDRKWCYIRLEGRNFGDVPAEPGAQARGLGLAELGRRDHRRRALRQGRPRPRHRRPAARPVGVLHEVAAGAVPRRGGPRDGRGVRPRRRELSAISGETLSGPRARCHARGPRRRGARTRRPRSIGPSSRRSLEQEVERVADDPARRDAEVRHHLAAVERRPDRVELLLLAQLGDAPLELVHAPRRARRRASGCASCSRTAGGGSARRAGRRRRARSGARPCRSSPSRRCGCAGGGTRAS